MIFANMRNIALAFSLMEVLEEILGFRRVKFGRVQRKTVKIPADHVNRLHSDNFWLTIK
jgi:hypothetical protein